MSRMLSAVILAVTIWMLCVNPPGAAATNAIEIPIHVSGRTPMIDVLLDGKGPYRFVIDTGTYGTKLDEQLVQELGLALRPSRGREGADSGDEESSYCTIPVLQIGGLEFDDVEAEQWDNHPLSPGSEEPDGILGTEVLADYLFVIDNPRNVLGIKSGSLPKPNGRDLFGYSLVDDAPQVGATIGNIELDVQIHSASFGPVLLQTEYIEQLPLRNAPGRIGNVSIDGVTADILGTRLAGSMTIGKVELDRPSVHFSDAFSANQLGFGALRSFVITLDQVNQRIRLDADVSYDEQLAALAARVPSLDEGAVDLKTAFNRDKDKTRLIVILSPT